MSETDTDLDAGARDAGREELLERTAEAPKKKRRWRLRIAIGLPVALGLFVLMLPTILSTGLVRGKIVAAIGGAAGRRAEIEDHSIGWWSPVKVAGLTIYEKDGTTPFLKIREATIRLPYRPLLDDRVELEAVEVAGVEVRVVKRRDGSLSTDDLGEGGKTAEKKPATDRSGGLQVSFQSVKLRDVSVTLVDEAAGRTVRLTGLTLDAKPGKTAEEIAARVAARVALDGAAGGDVKVEAELLALEGGMPRKEITGAATVSYEGCDLAALANAFAPMEGVDWATGASTGTLKAKLLAGGTVEAAVDAKLPAFRWGAPGEPPMMATWISVRQDLVFDPAASRVELKPGGKVQFAGADIQVNGTLDLPKDPSDADNPLDLIVKFDGETSHFDELFPAHVGGHDMKGTLRSNWVIKGPDFDRLSIEGVAEVTNWKYVSHGEDGATSEYVVPHPGFLKLSVKGSLDGKRREARAAAEPGRAWAALDGLSLDVRVATPWLKSEFVDIKQVIAELDVREQAAELRKFSFVLNGGAVSCDGRATFDAEDPAWTFRTKVPERPVAYSHEFSGLAALVNPALYADQQGQIEAAMAWDVSLRGRGFSMEALTKTLEGEGTLGLRRGAITGSAMLKQLFDALKLAETPKFEFALMDQKFRVSGGKVLNEFSNWQGEGKSANITIKGWTDFDGNMKQAITVEGDPVKRWGETTGRVVNAYNKAGGLPVEGTVSEPRIAIDFEKALKGAVEGVLEDPKVKEKIEEKANDLLDDLFKKKKKK
jgi:uncharacterized protein involved in outer membrane biogenesis